MSAASVVAQGRKEYKDEQLLARLIGAAVLLAIAVIVLPFVLDGAGSQREYEYAESLPVEPAKPRLEKSFSSRQPQPEPPRVKDVPIVTTQPPPVFESPAVAQPEPAVKAVSQPAAPVTPPVTAPAESASSLVSRQIPLGYNIQVASFVREANAQKLLDRLSGQDLPAFLNRVEGKKQPILRVFVGPIESQIDALAIKNQVDRTYRVESILVTRN
ncbi:MAG: SPOR domain-containing protein [Pseudomonadota bacterium]